MYMNIDDYNSVVKRITPKSNKVRDFLAAFLLGGAVCVIGELLGKMFEHFSFGEKTVPTLVAVSLIFIAAVLTCLKFYIKIAEFAGAGVLVPITGFSNAVVAPAIEFKHEGYVLGVGTKIFSIAGPVILYGTVAGVIYGAIYYLMAVIF